MLEKLLSLIFGGGGAASAVTGIAKVAGVATLAPLAWRWYETNADHVVLTLTVSQAVFMVGFVVALLQVAHAARGSSA